MSSTISFTATCMWIDFDVYTFWKIESFTIWMNMNNKMWMGQQILQNVTQLSWFTAINNTDQSVMYSLVDKGCVTVLYSLRIVFLGILFFDYSQYVSPFSMHLWLWFIYVFSISFLFSRWNSIVISNYCHLSV